MVGWRHQTVVLLLRVAAAAAVGRARRQCLRPPSTWHADGGGQQGETGSVLSVVYSPVLAGGFPAGALPAAGPASSPVRCTGGLSSSLGSHGPRADAAVAAGAEAAMDKQQQQDPEACAASDSSVDGAAVPDAVLGPQLWGDN